MRLLHTSDWHLGISFRGASAADDQRYFIKQITEIIKEHGIDAVLIAGDIFDRSIASSEAIELYDEAVTAICAKLGAKLFVIAGNHDGAQRLSQCGKLLESAGLYVCGSLKREQKGIILGNTEIFLLPWISTDKVRALYPEEAEGIASMQDAYELVCRKMREAFTPGLKHIVLSHAFTVNAETSVSDRSAELGMASAVSGSVFDGFDYAALGHIHKPQDAGADIRYSGSPMPYSFGREEKQEKSVTIIDTADMSREIIPIKPLHRRTTLTGTYDELMHADIPDEVRRGYTKLIITDIHPGLEAISYLRERYDYPLEISGKQFESDDASITLTPEEFEQRAREPEEIFRQFCIDTGHEEPDAHFTELFREAQAACEGADEE